MVAKTNVLDFRQFNRLHSSIEWSGRQMDFSRKKRLEAIRQYIGYHHTDGGSDKRVMAPFLRMAINIYVRLLAPQAPRCLVGTRNMDLKPTAANLELAINMIPEEIRLQQTLRRVVMEALFSLGVVKIGLHTAGEVMGHAYGRSFVDVVTQDDLIIDMAAKHMDKIQYIGNEYWLDYDRVMQSNWFPKSRLEGLNMDEYTTLSPTGQERAEGIAINETPELFKDKIWLRDIWLPSERLLVTYAVTSERRLKEVDWTGPTRGPYPVLGFDDVPGNLLPCPPVAAWRDVHEIANVLCRKLSDEADAQKTVQGFPGGNDEDVTNFRGAKDGGAINYHGGDPKILKAGGVDSGTLMFFLQLKDLMSYIAGNLDGLGGLSPQSETLGQDKLLDKSSGAQMRDMADRVIDFSKEVFQSLGFYEWNDPIRRRQLEKPIPGTDLTLIVPWNRESRRGGLKNYDLSVDVHSLQDNSPGMKLQKLGFILEKYVFPLMPAIERQGGTLDVQAILATVGKYADFPEIAQLVQFTQELPPQAPAPAAAAAPNGGVKKYERVNRPGATERGKSQIMQQILGGSNVQEGEMASLGRPTG